MPTQTKPANISDVSKKESIIGLYYKDFGNCESSDLPDQKST